MINTRFRSNRPRHSIAGLIPVVLATALAGLPSVAFAIDSDGNGLDDSVETNPDGGRKND